MLGDLEDIDDLGFDDEELIGRSERKVRTLPYPCLLSVFNWTHNCFSCTVYEKVLFFIFIVHDSKGLTIPLSTFLLFHAAVGER